MHFAGVDVGAESIKVVILEDDRVMSSYMMVAPDEDAAAAASRAMEHALEGTGLSLSDIDFIVSTGIGKGDVPFAHKQRSEQMCHARGTLRLIPTARTVVDAGAGGGRAMKLADDGRVLDFASNTKCAAGTGSFIEVASHVLEVPVAQMAAIGAKADGWVRVSSYCAVFGEAEIISHIHKGHPQEKIVAGVHEAVVDRLAEIANRVGIKEDLVLTGGVALNEGVVKALEKRLGMKVKVPPEPQMTGALGAALIARESAEVRT